jgi:hypothetical protein
MTLFGDLEDAKARPNRAPHDFKSFPLSMALYNNFLERTDEVYES